MRGRLLRALVAFLAILAFPSASAGSAEDPEAPDVSGDAPNAAAARYGDIVGAWIAGEDEDSFHASIGLAAFDGAMGVMLYFEFEFTYKGYAFDAYSYHDVDGS